MIVESQAIANQASELGRTDTDLLAVIQRDLLPFLDHHFPSPARGDALPGSLRDAFKSLLSSSREVQVDLLPEILDFISSIKTATSTADLSTSREDDSSSTSLIKAWSEGASSSASAIASSPSIVPATPGRVSRGQTSAPSVNPASRSSSRSPGGRGGAGVVKKGLSPKKAPQDELLVNGVIKLNFGNSRTPKKSSQPEPAHTSASVTSTE